MIHIKTKLANRITTSKKDFLFFDTDENNSLTNYILTNDFKRKKEFKYFRVVSTIQKELEFITIK
jgi:hypothetical protein